MRRLSRTGSSAESPEPRALRRSAESLRARTLSEPRPQHAVPPHDRAGHERGRGCQAEERPDRLGRLVADAGAVARDADAVDAAEVQVREPIERAVDEASARVLVRRRLQPVGQRAELIGEAQVHSAQGEHDQERDAPEAENAVQLPREPPPPHAAMQREVLAPARDAGPPDHGTREAHQQHGDGTGAVDGKG